MRKIVVLLVITALCLITGCEKKEEATQTPTDIQEQVEKKEEQVVEELTVEAVKNASVTAEDLFDYEEVEGGISITGYNGEETIVVIPNVIGENSVVKIGDNAFANNSVIQAIRLGENIVEIGARAFGNCKELQFFVSNNELQVVNEYAFNNCESLQLMELNQKVKKLDTLCFAGLDSLKEIYIPSSAQEIEVPFVNGTEVTIITEAGSEAEKYAAEAGIKCETR